MVDLTWKIFCQTGNIEAYLLLKELEIKIENEQQSSSTEQTRTASVNMHM